MSLTISKSMLIRTCAASSALLCLTDLALAQQNPEGLAKPRTARIKDALSLLPPSDTQPGGLLGRRYSRNEENRLLHVDEQELLAGFRKRPGKQAWIGEHVGKWLHAASLSYAHSKNAALRAKLDRVVTELLKTQEPNGYLGTYVPEKRWGLYSDADWDVWVHKYDLLGLLAYYQYTHNETALAAAKEIGDLLIATFGPGKKSILTAGTHVGMASTSVLEPVVLLYRATAEPRYLDFAKYIVASWEEPNGPKIASTLLRERSVQKTANGKAYEMLSNLNGLCELYRATGDRAYLQPVVLAWDDIVKHRLYITGTGSSFEHWQEEHNLPNVGSANIGETCVTVTWEQLNIQLLRLFGDARFADQLEKSVYNHLLGAQKPTGDAWCYYTPLEGSKPYGSATNCCLSSGPRGVALLPTFIYATTSDGVTVNFFTSSSVKANVPGGTATITQTTDFPLAGTIDLKVEPTRTAKAFALNLRVPSWTDNTTVEVNGKPVETAAENGYLRIRRTWKAGDRVRYTMSLPTRFVVGDHMNEGRCAVTVGPMVLAADIAHNPGVPNLGQVTISDEAARTAIRRAANDAEGNPVYEVPGEAAVTRILKPLTVRLVPFYAAGADGGRFQVWLWREGKRPAAGDSLFALGDESRSRDGNVQGLIADGDTNSFVVTYDNSKRAEDWFAVTSGAPVTINRVVFAHGKSFHDGGWFDTSAGKPRIEIRRTANGPWEKIATLDSYPATVASFGANMTDGQNFTGRFPAVAVFGVRVVGKPASGDRPEQAFASCAELQAYFDK